MNVSSNHRVSRSESEQSFLQEERDYLTQLPDELLLNIFQFCSHGDRIRVGEAFPPLKEVLKDKKFAHYSDSHISDDQIESISCGNYKEKTYHFKKDKTDKFGPDLGLLTADRRWIVMTDILHNTLRIIDRTNKEIHDVRSGVETFILQEGVLTVVMKDLTVKQFNLNENDFEGTNLGTLDYNVQNLYVDKDTITVDYGSYRSQKRKA